MNPDASIDDLELSVRTSTLLAGMGITTVGALLAAPELRLTKAAAGEIEEALAEKGLTYGGAMIVEAPNVPENGESERVTRIRAMCKTIGPHLKGRGASERVTIYAMEKVAKSDGSVNQVFGLPRGVDDERWPRRGEVPMVHVLTLDLGKAKGVGSMKAARAVALFLDDPDTNDALFDANPEFAQIVYLTEADVAKGVLAKTVPKPKPALFFRATPLEVPTFALDPWSGDDEPSDELQDLAGEVAALPGFAGGGPTNMDARDHEGHFLMQFNEDLVPINLGDAGTMFVFDDVAFYVGH